MANSVYQCKRFYDTGVLTVPSWYDVSHSFVEALSEEVPDEIRRDDNVTPDFTGLKRIWNDHHAAMLDNQKWWIVAGSLLIFLALVYAISSIIYCICLCRRKPSVKDDSSGAACKRTTLNVTLFILLVLGMCFLTFMLISSTDAKTNAARLPTYLSACLGDVDTYVQKAQKEADTAIINGFVTFADGAKTSVRVLISSTEDERKASQLTISAESSLLRVLNRNIERMERLYTPLQRSSKKLDALKDQLELLPKKLRTEVPDCKARSNCSVVIGKIQNVLSALHILKANITFAVPEAGDLPTKFDASDLLDERLALHASYETFLEDKLQKQTDFLAMVIKQMAAAQTRVDAISKEVSRKAASVTGFPQQLRDYVDEHGSTYANRIRYAWAGVILVGVLLFAILLLYLIGLAFGCFGRSPSEEKRSCVRTTGRTFYTIAIIVLAVIAVLLALLATFMVLLGAVVQTFVCGPLQDPLTDPLVSQFARQKHPTIAQVLQACGNPDATLFAALGLDKDLMTISDDVHNTIKRLQFQPPSKPTLPPHWAPPLPIFTNKNVTFVNELFSNFIKSTNISDLDELPLVPTLRSALDKVRDTRDAVRKMKSDWQSFAAAIKIAIGKLSEVQTNNTLLRMRLENGVEIAEAEAKEILRQMSERTTAYVSNVNATLRQILPCQPFKHIVEDSADAACRYVLDPFNGTWLALLLCLVTTFIIAFVSTCASRTYYRKMKQRPVRQWIPPPVSIIPESLTTDELPPVEDMSDYRPRKVPWTPQWEPATVNATQPSRNELLV